MASGFVWRGDLELIREIGAFDAKVHAMVSAVVDYTADEATVHMKTEAPWTDRTTAARNGLHTSTIHEVAMWTLVLAHAVNYGIWLETRSDFHGRYAVVQPSIAWTGQRLMESLENLFAKV